MAEVEPGEQERGLWQIWRALGKAEPPMPDALALAAYAESRLDEAAAEAVENWLAAHPEASADIAAARALTLARSDRASDAMIARASALVANGAADVVPFRRHSTPAWRNALAWSSVAASLIATSLVGFALGTDAYQNLSRSQAVDTASADALDAPATPDFYFSDESGT